MSVLRVTFVSLCLVLGTFFGNSLQVYAIPVHITAKHSSSTSFVGGPPTGIQTAAIFISSSTNKCGVILMINTLGETIISKCNQLSTAHTPLNVVKPFFRDVNKAVLLQNLPHNLDCVKSIAFGTTTVVTIKTQISPDVSCSVDKDGLQLYHDTLAILAVLYLLP